MSGLAPTPYVSTAVSIAVSVIVMALLRLVYPPAVSTSLVFSYQPHDVPAVVTYVLSLVVVIVLAFLYLVLHKGIRPSRWALMFGLLEESLSQEKARSEGD